MNITYVVLLILLLIYIPFYLYVRSSPAMKERGIVKYGPCVMFKTKHGIRFLDKAARYKRFWKAFGTLSKVLAFFLMIVILFIIVIDLLLLPLMMDSSGIGIEYALALPGINPMLPLVYGVIGLVVAVAIHEIAHGIQTRANDMDVESVGILYAVVPLGAFVEPNEEQIQKCSRKARSDMFAAGIAVNIIAALVIFLVMTMGMMGSVSSNVGDRAAVMNVSADSPADDSGMGFSSVMLKIGSDEITYDELMEYDLSPLAPHSVVYMTSDGPKQADNVYLGVFIDGIAKGSPAEKAGIPKNSFLISVDGHDVSSIEEFKRIMQEKVAPGASVPVVYSQYIGGVPAPEETVTVKLDERDGNAFLGVTYSLSGFSFTTPDTVLQMAKNPFHGADSISDMAYSALSYIGRPFSGYSPVPQELQWWYHSSFMSDGAFWIVVQTMFWIFWLNLVLAVTNALPAVPFDGGYLFRDGVGAIVDRTHKDAAPERREKITDTVTRAVSYIMLCAFFLIMVVMVI
ncbi:MAG: site-2 protease family protein [Methanomassiliicoccaceae archaeon]|nr:site-2 protease family protein [Methanomassiliicoccaceae archaeon]